MVDLLKIGLILAGIIVLIRLKVALSVTLIASALILGLLFQLPMGEFVNGSRRAFLSMESLLLVIALQLVLLFSAVTRENGSMQRAIAALTGAVRDVRFTVAIIPAIVGLLPVVGGAMLSAPLVAEAADKLRLPPERRTFLNYWFRHVWEYTLPTFPTVFLTAGITGVSIGALVAVDIPLTLAAMAAGVIFGFRGVAPFRPGTGPGSQRSLWKHLADFAWNLLPFFLVVLLTVGLDLHLAYPLAAVTTAVILLNRMPPARLLQLARQHLSVELAFLIWGIMLFKEILLTTQAMDRIAGDLSAMGIPTVLLVILLPALIAFITGYSTALVGLSFPVLVPFLQPAELSVYYVMLGLASGISAHLLSPLHPCLVMTMQFYRAGPGATFRLLFMPVAAIFLTGALVFSAACWLAG
jgi:integral membrane protein (TIGR00529 family)